MEELVLAHGTSTDVLLALLLALIIRDKLKLLTRRPAKQMKAVPAQKDAN